MKQPRIRKHKDRELKLVILPAQNQTPPTREEIISEVAKLVMLLQPN